MNKSLSIDDDDEIFIKLKLPNAYTFIINKSYTLTNWSQLVKFIIYP